MSLDKIFGKQEKMEEEKTLDILSNTESLRDKRIADLIAFGKRFFADKRGATGNYVGMPDALRWALDYAGKDGFVASMPEIVAARLMVDELHKVEILNNHWYTAHSEEDFGVDKKGLWVKKGEGVLVVLHGGGILTPGRIEQAYKEGLVDGMAPYSGVEFGDLLEGRLPSGEQVKLYTLDDLKRGVSISERRFGVVMPYKFAEETKSDYITKKEFVGNPLVLARIANLKNVEDYFDKAKLRDWRCGNFHRFKDVGSCLAKGYLPHIGFPNGFMSASYTLAFAGCFFAVSSGGA